MSDGKTLIGVSAVAIDGRAVLIEGSPGSGKSSLALALVDRGAVLIGDDGVCLANGSDQVIARPPPNIEGKMEIRGVGIVNLETTSAPLALILLLEAEGSRLPEILEQREIFDCIVPVLPFRTGDAIQATRAEWALRTHGLSF